MLLSSSSGGVFPIAPTPFRPNGEIDAASIERLIQTYRNVGANGATVLGMMGEAQKLDASEAVEVAAQFIKGMDLPVIVGVSAAGFAAMRSLTREVMSLGAAGVMIAPPPHLRTDDQIVGYFKHAVEAIGSDVPFVIQDYPLVLTVQMSPKVIRQIVQENPSCVMLKHEDWPGLDKISTLRQIPERRVAARHLNSHWKRWLVPGFRDGAGRGRRDDRICFSRDARGAGAAAPVRPA